MNNIVRNILAVLAGILGGSIVNMSLIQLGGVVIPPPGGADVTTAEGLKEAMLLFEPIHFLFPFLAHALGTLAGAWITAKIAGSHKMIFALGMGLFFLLGGISMILMVPSPLWFTLTDLILAYIPMAYLGGKWAGANGFK